LRRRDGKMSSRFMGVSLVRERNVEERLPVPADPFLGVQENRMNEGLEVKLA
jgi:hypothetical protein